jgi:nitroimidazol reductase NimA-like FMN-containing flavoprotein (pyridoxamine 5'-phosphate oxidase superfamily)
MRRNEFDIADRDRINRFLLSQSSGILTVASEIAPYSVPMNFAWDGEMVLIHSAPEGKKVPLLKAGKQGQFTVYKEYSVIPSFYSQSREACNATQFFISVMIFGQTGELTDPAAKAHALYSLMEQVQGKGTFPPLSADNPGMLKMLNHVGVFFLKAESITAKFKAGQNLSDERADEIIESLFNRGTPQDIETIELMREMRQKKS